MRILRNIGIGSLIASPLSAQAIYQPPADISTVSNTAQQALQAAQAAKSSADSSVKSVNGQSGAVTVIVPNLTGYATTANVSSALTPYATTTAVNSAIVAATPPPCAAPLADTLTGSAGIGAPCMARPDATRPTQVQRLTVVTGNDGTFSGSWSFVTTPVTYWATADVVNGSSAPTVCNFFTSTVTATAFSGKCWQVVPTTLPSTLTAIGGLTVSPVTNVAGGITVRVTGRQ